MRSRALGLLALSVVSLLPAQGPPGTKPPAPDAAADPAALAAREQKLTARAVSGLHAVADAFQAQKQHRRALELRREIWLDYAEDDAVAREKCGFVRVGAQWRRDAQRLVLDRDAKVEARLLRKAELDLQALTKDLLAEHRALAAGLTAAGDADRARKHWQRVLRFQPGDKDAAAALALQQFEGFHGSPFELDMLRRGRAIRGGVEWLLRKKFDVGPADGKHEMLTAAKLEHTGVRSENFEVWGTVPPALLTTIAEDAERTLLLCRMLFGTSTGRVFTPVRLRNLVFVGNDAAYQAVLDVCADQFDAARLAFLRKDVAQAFVRSGSEELRLHKCELGEAVARDQTVRGVAQDATGLTTDGLWEGMGHATCNLLFGRTLTFLVEQQHERTVASHQSRPLLPDLATWMQIAEESAWGKSDTRTSELVLLSAARFSTEQRVKAWAICDYLLHWRPELVLELDQSRPQNDATPPGVEAEFLRRTKVDLPKLDAEWREFWARAQPLRKAMATDPAGDEKAPDRAARLRARSLVDALNDARAASRRGPVGFFVATSGDADVVAKYGEALVKAEAEQKKKPKVEVPMPAAPPMLGRTIYWSRREKAADAVADWLVRPALRDVLVDPGRSLCGVPLGGGNAWILDVTMPAMPTKSGPPLCWPRNGQKAVPGQVVVSELGPRAVAALTAAGKQPGDTVGMPLTLHFGRAMKGSLGSVTCRVFAGSFAAKGVTVLYEGTEDDGDNAIGCVAFIPLEPLAGGADVSVDWTLPKGILAKQEAFPTVVFTVR